MNLDFRQQVQKAGFRIDSETHDFCKVVQRQFSFRYMWGPLQLFVGRSLADPTPPLPARFDGGPRNTLRGEQLFGMDGQLDAWISVLIEACEFGAGATAGDLKTAVEAHLQRGMKLVRDAYEEEAAKDTGVLARLAMHLPDGRTGKGHQQHIQTSVGAVVIPVGEISTLVSGGAAVNIHVNGEGGAPHIALMGRNGTGKTRTGVLMLAELAKSSKAPILVLDPKGDFAPGGRAFETLRSAVPKLSHVSLAEAPLPLSFLGSPDSGDPAIMQAAMRFRDSLALCTRGVGDLQKQRLRISAFNVIKTGERRGLEEIQNAYSSLLEEDGKPQDSVSSRLDELTALHLFEPSMTAEKFFSQSWVVSMNQLTSEEVKRLAILLILDSLAVHVISRPDARLVGTNRSLRHILFIDEARRILAESKYQSLVDLLRQGRSKGEVLMLISQDPSDFHGGEDYTGQVGTLVAFACSAHRGLRSLSSIAGRKLQPAEFSTKELPKGVALVKTPDLPVAEKVRCWEPSG